MSDLDLLRRAREDSLDTLGVEDTQTPLGATMPDDAQPHTKSEDFQLLERALGNDAAQVDLSFSSDPTRARKNKSLSKDTGLPEELVEAAPEEAQQLSDRKLLDKVSGNRPRTRGLIADPLKGRYVHDDVGLWAQVEDNAVGAGTAVGRALQRGGLGIKQGFHQHRAEEDIETARDIDRSLVEIIQDQSEGTPIWGADDIAIGLYRWFSSRITTKAEEQAEALENLQAAGEAAQRAAALPKSETATATLRNLEAVQARGGNILDMAVEAVKDPLGTLALGAEIGLEFAPQIAAAGVTARFAGPGAGVAMLGGLSGATERFRSPLEVFNEAGFDVSKREDAIAVLNNPDLMREAESYGFTRGAIIGTVDAMTGGLATRAFGGTIRNLFTQGAIQMVGGGGGEALAQLATKGEVDQLEVFLEAIGEMSTAPLDIAALGVNKARAKREARERAKAAVQFKERISNIVDAAGQTKTMRENPELFQEAMETLTQDTDVEEVHVSALGLSAFTEAAEVQEGAYLFFGAAGVDPAEVDLAIHTGQDITIPIDKYVEALTKSAEAWQEGRDAVLANTRKQADAATFAEAEVFFKDDIAEFDFNMGLLQDDEVDALLEEGLHAQSADVEAALAPIRERLLKEAKEAGVDTSAARTFVDTLGELFQTETGGRALEGLDSATLIDALRAGKLSPSILRDMDAVIDALELPQSTDLRGDPAAREAFILDLAGVKTLDIARALEVRTREKHGTIARNDRSPEAIEKLAGWMLEEVLFELAPSRAATNGVGWYGEKFQRALDILGEKYPELVDEEAAAARFGSVQSARDFMTAIIAVTSDGQKVTTNYSFADRFFGQYVETGTFDLNQKIAQTPAIAMNLEGILHLVDTMGFDGMRDALLQEDTVSNLKKQAKTDGQTLNSKMPADRVLPKAALIFGPKLGSFYANLMGAHGYLTMDRWWTRTINRYRGTLSKKPTRSGLDRVKALVIKDRRLNTPPELVTDDEVISYAAEYAKQYEAKGFKNGTELERAANTVWKDANGIQDDPFNTTDRGMMIDAVNRAQELLSEQGHEVSVADIQAILWYYEKRLYSELGARATADISYAEAARSAIDGRADTRRIDPDEAIEGPDGSLIDVAGEPAADPTLFQRTGRPDRSSGRLLEFIKGNPDGFTVAVDGKTVPASGIAFAPVKGAEIVVALDDLSEDHVDQLVDNIMRMREISGLDVHAGGWLNEEDGMFYLDASLVVDDLDQALYFADAAEQIAVFDLGEFNELNTQEGIEQLQEAGAYSRDAHDDARRRAQELAREFEGAGRGSEAFFQDAQGSFNPDTLTIKLFRDDLSTLLHEGGHLFVELLGRMAALPDASQRLKDNYQAMLDWVGAESAADLDLAISGEAARAKQEKLAEAFEAYLKEGKAPSAKLRRAFAQFRAWLMQVYESITSTRTLNIEIDDTIREVFDKMLATDAEIAEQAVLNEMHASSLTPEVAELMTAEERAAHEMKQIEADAAAAEQRAALDAAQEKKAQQAQWRKRMREVTEEVTEQVWSRPDYAAFWFLTRGSWRDEDTPASMANRRFSKTDLLEELTEDELASIPKGRRLIYSTKADEISPADPLAAFLGFEDASELLFILRRMRPAEELIREQAEVRVRSEMGDPFDGKTVEEFTEEALYSQERLEAIELEMQAIARAAGKVAPSRAAINQLVDSMMQTLPIKDIRKPAKFVAAAVRSAKAAGKAEAQGDHVAALEHKRKQMLNHELARRAINNAKRMETKLKYLRGFSRTGKWSGVKAEYLDRIREVTQAYRFGSDLSDKKRAELNTEAFKRWQQAAERGDGAIFILPPELLEADSKPHWTEMTLAHFDAIHAAVKNIHTQGRNAKKLLSQNEDADRQTQIQSMLIRMQNLKVTGRAKRIGENDPGLLDPARQKLALLDASLLKAQFILEFMDGGPDGPAQRAFYDPFAAAERAEADRIKDFGVRFEKAFAALPARVKRGMNKTRYNEALGQKVSRSQLIHMALNTGNPSNFMKMVEGWTKSPFGRAPITDAQVIEALQDLTAEEIAFVNEVWQLFEDMREDVGNVWRREKGEAPKWMDDMPIELANGTLTGGYIPMMYDPKLSRKGDDIDTLDALASLQSEELRATVFSGMTQARTGFSAPVLLDLTRIPGKLQETAHFITHYEAVRNANKLLQDGALEEEIVNKLGQEYYNALKNWVGNIANNGRGQVLSFDIFAGFTEWMRTNATVAIMGASATTIMTQPLGIFTSIDTLARGTTGKVRPGRGAVRMLEGMLHMLRPGVRTAAVQMSTELRDRRQNSDREIRHAIAGMRGMKGNKAKWQRMLLGAIPLVQYYAADLPTWIAAYNIGLEDHMTTEAAARFADRTINRTQGGGSTKDLSAVQALRGSPRAFTMFMTFFSTLYGIQRRLGRERAWTPDFAYKLFVGSLIVYILPSAIEGIFRLEAPDPDDEPEEYAKWLAMKSLLFAGATVPLARDFVSGALSEYGYSQTPLASLGESVDRAFNEAWRLITDEKDVDQKTLRTAVTLIGFGTGLLPTTQINRAVKTWEAEEEGEDPHWFEWLVGPDKRDE